MPTRYFLSPPFIAAAPTAADFAQVSPASPSPISCCLSGASPAPGPRMPAVPAPHLEVHGCKRPRRDRWPRERGAGREHPALTPLADGSGAWARLWSMGQHGSLEGPQQRRAAEQGHGSSLSQMDSPSSPASFFPVSCIVAQNTDLPPRPWVRLCSQGGGGSGGSYTAWLLLTSPPAPHLPHPHRSTCKTSYKSSWQNPCIEP